MTSIIDQIKQLPLLDLFTDIPIIDCTKNFFESIIVIIMLIKLPLHLLYQYIAILPYTKPVYVYIGWILNEL